MTTDYEPEFTHKQGLAVALAGAFLFFGLLYFVEEHQAELAFGAFAAIASTMVVRRDLLRCRWFLAFISIAAFAHIAFVLIAPWTDFSRGGFKLFVLCDVLLVLGLAFALERLVLAWERRST